MLGRGDAGVGGHISRTHFPLVAVGSAALGFLMRDGGDGGAGLYAVFVTIGVGMALGFRPTLTGALANVRPEDAADASGVLVTVTRLGQLIGVAGFGTLYLNRLDTPGVQGSGEALWVWARALSAAAVVGVLMGLARHRRTTGSRQG